MTLSFSTNWADGKPNDFVPKIWKSILRQYYDDANATMFIRNEMDAYYKAGISKILNNPNNEKHLVRKLISDSFRREHVKLSPKLHTIREDKKDRWEAGNKIHPVVNNRTPNRFQFCPTLVCHSTQEIKIINYFTNGSFIRKVYIDNSIKPFYQLYPKKSFLNKLNSFRMLELVKNDGFDDIESFFNFFFPNGTEGTKTLKLIHWTNLKY